jgi:hypothetical protein
MKDSSYIDLITLHPNMQEEISGRYATIYYDLNGILLFSCQNYLSVNL